MDLEEYKFKRLIGIIRKQNKSLFKDPPNLIHPTRPCMIYRIV